MRSPREGTERKEPPGGQGRKSQTGVPETTPHVHLEPLPPGPPRACLPGGSDISACVMLIEFNCLLQVALKPFPSPLKLGNIDNTAPQGLNLCPPQER